MAESNSYLYGDQPPMKIKDLATWEWLAEMYGYGLWIFTSIEKLYVAWYHCDDNYGDPVSWV